MPDYRQGEVVLVKFPFTDQTAFKVRPAVVISANWYNNQRSDCIVVPITTTIHNQLSRDEILIQGTELRHAGLDRDCVVKTGTPFTVSQNLIHRSKGNVSRSLLQRILAGTQDTISQ